MRRWTSFYCDNDERLAISAEKRGCRFCQWTISRACAYRCYSNELQKRIYDHASEQPCEKSEWSCSTRFLHFSRRDEGVFRAAIRETRSNIALSHEAPSGEVISEAWRR